MSDGEMYPEKPKRKRKKKEPAEAPFLLYVTRAIVIGLLQILFLIACNCIFWAFLFYVFFNHL